MTWFQWFVVVWSVLVFLTGAHYHGKDRQGKVSLSDVMIKLGLINWMIWYAGGWN